MENGQENGQQKMTGSGSLDDLSFEDIAYHGPESQSSQGTQEPVSSDPPVPPQNQQAPKEPPVQQTAPPQQQTPDPATQKPADGGQAQEPPVQTNPWNTVFGTLKEKTGLEFQDESQLVNELQTLAEFKKDPNAHLPAEIKAHMDFIQNGGNTQDFYRLKSMDFENMSPRDVLFQSYLQDNPDITQDMEFARMSFDREFQAKYSILNSQPKTQADFLNEDDEPDVYAYQNYLNDRTFAEKNLKFSSDKSKAKLVEWQKSATTPPKNPNTGLSEEEAFAYANQYQEAVNSIKSVYKGEEFPISEDPNENLKLGLNETVKAQWEQDLVNPGAFFNELGLHKDGKIDLNKLAKASFKFRMFEKLGPIAKKLIIENQNRQTVAGTQQSNGSQQTGISTQNNQFDDELEEIAEAVAIKERTAYRR